MNVIIIQNARSGKNTKLNEGMATTERTEGTEQKKRKQLKASGIDGTD